MGIKQGNNNVKTQGALLNLYDLYKVPYTTDEFSKKVISRHKNKQKKNNNNN